MKFVILFSLIVAISAVQQQQCGTLLNQQQGGQQSQFFPWVVAISIKDTQKLMLRDYFIMVNLTPQNERSQIPSLQEMQRNLGTHKQIQQPSFMCSGVLISNNFVLTSAKCVYNITASDLIVNYGLTDLKQVKQGQNEVFVSKVIVRKDFNVENVDNNLALLQLSKPIEHMSNMVNTICLPQQQQEQLQLGNIKEILGGYGFYEPVKHTQQHFQQQGQQQMINQKFRHSFIKLQSLQQGKCEGGKNTLCAVAFNQQSDVCLGDDGSPVFHELNKKFVLDGVVSFYNSENEQQLQQQKMGGQTSQEEQQQDQEQVEQCKPSQTKITITNVKPYLNWINKFVQQTQQQHTMINTKKQTL